ncbi:MotA/TolQ/ExbB proton channel family protein [candidate division KSB1 bacterium]|nr:MotA/TolQ/ExbB proton channel family protein [candidate division KSB1 bacterium]
MFVRRMPAFFLVCIMIMLLASVRPGDMYAQSTSEDTQAEGVQSIETPEVNPTPEERKQEKGKQGQGKGDQDDAGLDQEKLMKLVRDSGMIGVLTILILAVGLLYVIMTRFRLSEDIQNSQWVLDKVNEIPFNKTEKLKPLTKFIAGLKDKYLKYKDSLKNAGLLYLIKENFLDLGRMIIYYGKRITGKRATSGNPEDIAVKTTVFELLFKLYQVFDATKDTESFNSELSNFVQAQKDKFNPFQTVMAYLSDTAGALGLLGTVWGMFITFHRGTMDQQEIISGMGIALSTTIIGLVVSLILNTFTTGVSNKFDNRLDAISTMANELQVNLLNLGLAKSGAGKSGEKEGEKETDSGEEQTQPEMEKAPEEEPSDAYFPDIIEVRSGADQEKPVASVLDPIEVQIRSKDQVPVPKAKVIFTVSDGGGVLDGGRTRQEVETDFSGLAKVKWTLGEQSGEKYLTITAENYSGEDVKIKAIALPGQAEKITLVSGKFQNGIPNQELEKPLSVRIVDRFKNPIENIAVNFKMVEGSGVFIEKANCVVDRHNGSCTVSTNKTGIAEANFTLGKEQGVYKIVADTPGLQEKIEFQAFANYD